MSIYSLLIVETKKLKTTNNLLLHNKSPMRKIYAQDKSENSWHHTDVALGKEYHLSIASIQKYGRYAGINEKRQVEKEELEDDEDRRANS